MACLAVVALSTVSSNPHGSCHCSLPRCSSRRPTSNCNCHS
jgi:hypothetical protein